MDLTQLLNEFTNSKSTVELVHPPLLVSPMQITNTTYNQPTGMKSFPTVYELAAATEDEVNAHWAGLGFYRRARYLHQGAKYVVQELDGKLPTTPERLLQISGIGPYTVRTFGTVLQYRSCIDSSSENKFSPDFNGSFVRFFFFFVH